MFNQQVEDFTLLQQYHKMYIADWLNYLIIFNLTLTMQMKIRKRKKMRLMMNHFSRI